MLYKYKTVFSQPGMRIMQNTNIKELFTEDGTKDHGDNNGGMKKAISGASVYLPGFYGTRIAAATTVVQTFFLPIAVCVILRV